jgi:hypothetical protein
LLLIGSSSPDDANDLSTTDFIKPHAGIRKKALESEMVSNQEKYSTLHFTKANNILESNPDDEGMNTYVVPFLILMWCTLDETRHCELSGTSFNNDFSITFDVREPSMAMSNLVFNVGFEMQLEIGEVLER